MVTTVQHVGDKTYGRLHNARQENVGGGDTGEKTSGKKTSETKFRIENV